MAANESFDLIVIGGGPAGLAAAQRAAELRRRTALVAPPPLGGACLNWGCLFVRYLRQVAAAGPAPSLGPLAWATAVQGVGNQVARLRDSQKEALQRRLSLQWFPVAGRLLGPNRVRLGEEVLMGEQIIVATGARFKLAAEMEKVGALSPSRALALDRLPASVLVLGSDRIGLEVAQIFARFGSSVALVEGAERLAPHEEPQVSQALEEVLGGDGVQIWTEMKVESLRLEGSERVAVLFDRDADLRQELRAEVVIASGQPQGNTAGLGLEEVGVELDEKGFIKVDETFHTAVPSLWAAGDVTGEPFSSSVAGRSGTLAARNALEDSRQRLDRSTLPVITWTMPEAARVGLGEQEAWESGHLASAKWLPLSRLALTTAGGPSAGVIKLVVEANAKRLLGAHLVAPGAAELIHLLAFAIRSGLTLYDLEEALFATPTVAEGLRLTARALLLEAEGGTDDPLGC